MFQLIVAKAQLSFLENKANLRTNSWLLEVNSTQLALKLAARKALIIRSSGYLIK
ncbi:hypothetical protein [Pseudoalteromonas sp. JC3]|uniref:hypothetical protein n=1 Tax=Pseudoalteromonas sp. JC3 TaxID=2810196 RepID=UPI0019CFB6D5|nr:hypothetical protein [Pseudoalteromonas sp. JC3]MBR8842108.1 hypothetical protein [Pseudoalteromonas sp. JC3]